MSKLPFRNHGLGFLCVLHVPMGSALVLLIGQLHPSAKNDMVGILRVASHRNGDTGAGDSPRKETQSGNKITVLIVLCSSLRTLLLFYLTYHEGFHFIAVLPFYHCPRLIVEDYFL